MKVINCFILSIFFLIAGCGNIKWFPGGSTGPALTLAFSASTAQIGNPVTLTFTITNVADNPLQSNLTFTDTLKNISNGNGNFPVFVANPNVITNTCGGTIYTGGTTNAVSPGDQSFTFTGGSLAAGTTSCTVSIDITSNGTTNPGQPFTNGPGDVTSNLDQGNLTAQSLDFTPFTNGTLAAKDLRVTTTNTTAAISLFVNNSGGASVPTVTVTVQGFDTSSPPSSLYTATILLNNVAQGNNQPVSQSFTDSSIPNVKTWEITAITN
jgi:hypothetical protein